MANAKRRAALAAEKRAIEAAEKARLAALEAANTPTPPPRVTEAIFKALVAPPPRHPPRAVLLVRAIDRQTRSNREHPTERPRVAFAFVDCDVDYTRWTTKPTRAPFAPSPPTRALPADADAILSILPPWVGFLTPLFFFVPLLFSSSPSRRRLFSEVDDDDRDVILGSEPDGALHERVRELIRAHVRVLLRLLLDERRALGGVDRVP